MTQHPSPLGYALASLREAPLGAHRGMLPAAMHTLITAILTRIFAHLEQILVLFQAGQLPAPTPRAYAPLLPAATRARHHNTQSRHEPRRGTAPACDPQQIRASIAADQIPPGHVAHRANPRAAPAGSRPCQNSRPSLRSPATHARRR